MHDEGPHTPTLLSVSQGATRDKAGEEKDRDTHQCGGREKVHVREKGEQRKGKRATKPRKKQGVASSRAKTRAGKGARQAHSTRQAPHRTEAPERGAPEGQEKSSTTHHYTHGTDTTHTAHTHTCAHSTWPGSPGSPPRGRAAGKRWRLNPDAPRHPRGAQPPTRARRPRGRCRAPTQAHLRPQHVGSGPRQPAQRAGSRERGSA